MEIASVRKEPDWPLEENKKLKEMFDLKRLVTTLSKAVSNLGVEDNPSTYIVPHAWYLHAI